MKKKIHIIFGGSGFVGRNLCEKLNKECKIIIFDICKPKINNKNIFFYKINLSNLIFLKKIFDKILKRHKINTIDYFWHFAANSDIKLGSKVFSIDLKNTFLTVFNTVELLKKYENKIRIKNFIFSSSSAVYGDHSKVFSEESKTLPISNYGSMKLAAEAVLSSYSLLSKTKILIIRFPNVVGKHMTHGLLFDLKNKILKNKNSLSVLGNGTQTKQYMTANYLIDVIFFILKKNKKKIDIINIGPNDYGISVREIINIFLKYNKINPKVTYEKNNYGWIGDVNTFRYKLNKLKKIGWKSSKTSYEAIYETVAKNKIYED